MRLRACSVLFVCLLLPHAEGLAQGLSLRLDAPAPVNADSTASLLRPGAVMNAPRSLVLLPAGAATAHYGFFCRQELKWDKALPFQLRFRAGAPADCDRLEGKQRD